MSIAEEVDLLKSLPMFAKVEPSKLKLLAFTSERLAFDDDQELFHQGEPGDAAYLVIAGEVVVSIDAPGGRIELAKLGRGAIVGEIAILCDVPRTATVTAQGATVTLRISKDLFFRLITEFPQIAVEVMRELAHRLENTNIQLREARAGKPH
jgi:CRP/FNR family cyclic AMP-dependent transcriptional regulator